MCFPRDTNLPYSIFLGGGVGGGGRSQKHTPMKAEKVDKSVKKPKVDDVSKHRG